MLNLEVPRGRDRDGDNWKNPVLHIWGYPTQIQYPKDNIRYLRICFIRLFFELVMGPYNWRDHLEKTKTYNNLQTPVHHLTNIQRRNV